MKSISFMIESGICHNCFAVNNVLRCQSYKNSLSANSFRSHEAQKKPNNTIIYLTTCAAQSGKQSTLVH